MTPQPKPYSLPINILFDGYDYELISKAAKLNDVEEETTEIENHPSYKFEGLDPEYYED